MVFNDNGFNRVFGKEHCVYRYVENGTGKVLYVGKTNSSLRARVTAHRYEEGFQKAKDFHVEYIALSNAVETDCIEKYFINKWKPVLNTKDNVDGLTVGIANGMEEVKWIPYSEYEKTFKNVTAVKKQVENANKKSKFLQEAIFHADKGEFTYPYLHGALLMPFPDKDKAITELDVKPCFGGYRYKLRKDVIGDLIEYKDIIKAAIWLPVLCICEMSDDEELLFSVLMDQIEFGNEIDNFVLSGFEDEDSLYRYNFKKEYPGGDIYLPFQMVFDGKPYIDRSNRVISGEINPDTYEEEMPKAKEAIAKNIIDLASSLKIPVMDKTLVRNSDSYEIQM